MAIGPRANEIFAPLLRDYILQESPVIGIHIEVNSAQRIAIVDGRPVQNLANLEFRLLEYMVAKRGQVCAKDELAACLYPDDQGKDATDEHVEAVTKQLEEYLGSGKATNATSQRIEADIKRLRQYVDERDTAVSDGRIEAVVKRLRDAIERVSGGQRYIVNVRGHGFKLDDTGKVPDS